MASPRFIHLRVHSEHSLLEGAVPVKKLPKLAAEAGMPAVALTDSNAMFAALEFSDYASKAGIQPIIGAQLDLCYLPPEPGRQPYRPAPVVLLAQSEAGWMNLMKLNSCAHLHDTNGDGLYDKYVHMKPMAISGNISGNPANKIVQNGSANWTSVAQGSSVRSSTGGRNRSPSR